ncbi:MAG: MafI family immunity protein [Bacteroidota bacterium]
MEKNKAKEKVLEFVQEIQKSQKGIANSELEQKIQDSFELIDHFEFGVALENLIENLYEFDIPISQNQIAIAREAAEAMEINWGKFEYIEELKSK